jgi:Protein of unknown function (DUF2950)
MLRAEERILRIPRCALAASVSMMLATVLAMVLAATVALGAQTAGSSPPASSSSSKPAALAAARPAGKAFSSPDQAASALYDAARKGDENQIVAILGPGSRDIVFWTDSAADRKTQMDQFAKEYEQMHRLVREPDDETTLYVGAENWPLPVPLVEENGAWYFDTALGRREILYRRIGEDEARTIDMLHGIVDAEEEYHDQSPPPAGVAQYARLNSDSGQHDGLYWPGGENGQTSPLGPYVAQASYRRSDHQPYHGYYLRMLTGQGRDAQGGARQYVVDGKITGGFAFVAFPAEYRVSGVKTFIVNQDGTIFQKDLGPSTAKIAESMTTFDPDASWERVAATP